jgi:DNA-binding MarR family transcriptional regulator
MVASHTASRLEEIALDLFAVVTRLYLVAPRPRRRGQGLKEVEFLTLALLHERGSMIVGDLQRLLDILPAQMSRVIRSLEDRPKPLVACSINPRDKRKIDVCLTDGGVRALQDFQAVRLQRIMELLHDLPEQDQESLGYLLDKVRGQLQRGPGTYPPPV